MTLSLGRAITKRHSMGRSRAHRIDMFIAVRSVATSGTFYLIIGLAGLCSDADELSGTAYDSADMFPLYFRPCFWPLPLSLL
jgi:hypothetical protein